MAYFKTIWIDEEDDNFIFGESPKINAENLNKQEQGIFEAHEMLNIAVFDENYVHTDNNFTTILMDKINHVEPNATADQTGAEMVVAINGENDANIMTDAEKLKLAGLNAISIVDNLLSTDSTKTLSANQGYVLKGLIDSISSILTSDDEALDELQELVIFIKQNKSTLDTLAIANIAGLVDALAGKEQIDATIVRSGVANTFTAPQTASTTMEDNAIDFTTSNGFELTATATNITVGVMGNKKGQEGTITIHSAENITGWGSEFRFAPDFSAVTPTPPASPSGTMEFWYKVHELFEGEETANIIHLAWAK